MPLNDTQYEAPPESDAERSSQPESSLPNIPGYRLVSQLGEGAMGSVFLAIEENLGRRVAIKLMMEHFAETEGSLEQFEREAKTMATVEHPHVVRVYAFGDAGTKSAPRPYLAMEFVEGETLDHRIQREGGLGIEESLRITRETVQALRAAWKQRIVHRDMKPANILLDDEGRVRVGDFGIAKPLELGDGALTATGITLGTPRYVSPEQALGEKIDFRTDVYSTGVLLWECLVGRPPFNDANPMVLIKRHMLEDLPSLVSAGVDASLDLEQLLKKMTAKEREDRYASYEDVLEAIEAALNAQGSASASVRTSGRGAAGGWYYAQGRDLIGPFERFELDAKIESGEVRPKTYVWGPGFKEWKLAEELDERNERNERYDAVGSSTGAHLALSLISPKGKASSILEEMSRARYYESPTVPIQGANDPVTETLEGKVETPDLVNRASAQKALAALDDKDDDPSIEEAVSSEPEVTDDCEPSPEAPEELAEEGREDHDDAASSSALESSPPEDPPTTLDPSVLDLPDPLVKKRKKSSPLDAVLSRVDAQLDVQRRRRLRKGIRTSSVKGRFEEIMRETLRPALRDVMARLHQKGHPTRLQDVDGTTIRLEFVLDSRARCCVEVALMHGSTLSFRFLKNMAVVSQFDIPGERIDTLDVDGLLVKLLSQGLGREA